MHLSEMFQLKQAITIKITDREQTGGWMEVENGPE